MPTVNRALVFEADGRDPSDMSRAAAALQRPAARDVDPTWQARRATADDEQARPEQAERLLVEIEAVKSGRPGPAPKSPREFVDEQARTEREAVVEYAERPQRGERGE